MENKTIPTIYMPQINLIDKFTNYINNKNIFDNNYEYSDKIYTVTGGRYTGTEKESINYSIDWITEYYSDKLYYNYKYWKIIKIFVPNVMENPSIWTINRKIIIKFKLPKLISKLKCQ